MSFQNETSVYVHQKLKRVIELFKNKNIVEKKIAVEQEVHDTKIRKTNSSTKIVYDKVLKTWKVRKVTHQYFFNEITRKWQKEHENIEFLPLSTLNPEPSKRVVLPIIVTKPVVNADGELITGYFLREYEYKVTEQYPSEFLTVKHGIAFRHNFAVKECSPLPVIEANKLQGIIVTQVGADKKLTEIEAMTIIQSGIKVYQKEGNSLKFSV